MYYQVVDSRKQVCVYKIFSKLGLEEVARIMGGVGGGEERDTDTERTSYTPIQETSSIRDLQ